MRPSADRVLSVLAVLATGCVPLADVRPTPTCAPLASTRCATDEAQVCGRRGWTPICSAPVVADLSGGEWVCRVEDQVAAVRRVGPVPPVEPLVLTAGDVRAVYDAAAAVYRVEYRDKRTSALMRLVAEQLEQSGTISVEDFGHYTTTLGAAIYAPFHPGEPTAAYPLEAQPPVLSHELVHVCDLRREGVDFLLGYADSPRRALIEARGYRTGATVRVLLGLPSAGPDALAGHLASYRVEAADREVARVFLASAAATIADGGIADEPAAWVLRFVQARARLRVSP